LSTSPEIRARRGPKPKLSREQVIEAALDLIDSDGLGALNLRKLATRLDVSAMTPYSYFSDKAELVSATVEHALTPARLNLEHEARWDEHVLSAMRGLHAALDRHPGIVELIMAQSEGRLLEEFRLQLIEVLKAAGLTATQSADALRSLTSYVVGYAVLGRMRPRPARRHPPDSFELGLEMLMRSLREIIAAQD
jgi:AcrR family transcriptional regulator